jgi:hypothetical protein
MKILSQFQHWEIFSPLGHHAFSVRLSARVRQNLAQSSGTRHPSSRNGCPNQAPVPQWGEYNTVLELGLILSSARTGTMPKRGPTYIYIHISINVIHVSDFSSYYATPNLISPLVTLAQLCFDEATETSLLCL